MYKNNTKNKGSFIRNILFVIMLLSVVAYADGDTIVAFTDNWGEHPLFNVVSSRDGGVEITFSMHRMVIEEMEIDGVLMNVYGVPGILLPNDEGAPNLAGTGRYIAIPQGATAEATIIDARTEVYHDIEVAPAPNIPFESDTTPLRYEMNQEIYSRDAYYLESPVKLSEPMQIRGVDCVILGITPFQYNPITKELIVYKDIRVRVDFIGGNGHFGDDALRNPYWEPILQGHLLNYNSLPQIDFYSPERINARDGYEYIIIIPNDPDFEFWGAKIKNWRQQQGISTEVFTLNEIGGSTATAIENFLNNAYNTWNPRPVAFLILSDYPSSGEEDGVTSPVWNNYCVSDNIYADVNNDNLPDMFHGRICAQNESQLSTMINKFLSYEDNPNTSANFYNEPIVSCGWQDDRWFQLCAEVIREFFIHSLGKNPNRQYRVCSGYNPHAGCDWSTSSNTSTVVNYFYNLGWLPSTHNPYSYDWWNSGTGTGITNAINSGAFLIQHRDHGAETGWGTPYYSNSYLDNLTNEQKLIFVYSSNCLTGKYNWTNECFAEKFHRLSDGVGLYGALGVNAASELSYSFVNDCYVWGNYDCMWQQFMPDYPAYDILPSSNLNPCLAMVYGKFFLQSSSWPYNTDKKIHTYHLFHHHGDVFTTLYSVIPQCLNVAHSAYLIAGAGSFTVSANEGAVIALTVNGEIIGAGIGTGDWVSIPITPQEFGNTMVVTVTKANYFRRVASVPVTYGPILNISVRNYQAGDITINRVSNPEWTQGCPWAVGDCGQVFKLDQSGNIVRRFTLNSEYNLTGVSFEYWAIGYIVGYKRDSTATGPKWKGAIWKTTNGGINGVPEDWTRILDELLPQFDVPTPFLNVAAGFGGVVWVSCGHGYVLVSWDQGNVWTITSKPGSSHHYGWLWGLDVDYFNPSVAWVCSDQSRLIAQTTDGGQSWENYEPFPDDSLCYKKIDRGSLVAASKGTLLYNILSKIHPFGTLQTSQWFYGTCILGNMWGVGSGGIIGANYGKHWYSKRYDLQDIEAVAYPSIPSCADYYIVGSNATIIHGRDIGTDEHFEQESDTSGEDDLTWSFQVNDYPNDHGWQVVGSWTNSEADSFQVFCRAKPDVNLYGDAILNWHWITTMPGTSTGFVYDSALTGQKLRYRVKRYMGTHPHVSNKYAYGTALDSVAPPKVTGLQGRYNLQLDAAEIWWDPVPESGNPQYPETYEPNLGGYWVCPEVFNADYHINHPAPLYRTYYIESVPAFARGHYWGFWVQAMDRAGNRGVWSDSVYIWIPPRNFSNSPYATAFNQGRHLVRVPNTKELHMVYGTDGKIIYTYSLDDGDHWYQEELDNGLYPCIGINYKGLPWISYTKDGDLICKMKRPDGSWKEMLIYDGNENLWAGPPSMQLATMPIKDDVIDVIDYAYITYAVYEGTMPDNPGPQPPVNNHSYIYITLFDTLEARTHLLDEKGDPQISLSHPCVAVTPADLIHIAWQQGDEIWYVTNTGKITPENWKEVQWTQKYNLSNTGEVSEHPYVESYGDIVYVVWKEGDPGEIIRKERYVWKPSEYEKWSDAENLSNSPDYDSDYPQMSTNEVVLWQEQGEDGNYKVYANICGEVLCLTPEANNVSYVHTNVLVEDPIAPQIMVYYCYTDEITEGELYEVKFDKYLFPEGIAGEVEEVKYYEGKTGEEVASPYCELRTGYIDYGDYTIDYGNRLEYQLKYLDPCKHYQFQAIVYQDTTGTIHQKLEVEDTLEATVRVYPAEPETLTFFINPSSYKEDLESALEIIKTRGPFATIAEFKVYEYEVISDSGGSGSGPQSAGIERLPIPTMLYTPKPNPFTNLTQIRFQIPLKTKVELKVYNSAGRLVNALVDDEMNPGYYTMNWSGKDNQERICANGIYFVRLKTNDYDATKKMIMVK